MDAPRTSDSAPSSSWIVRHAAWIGPIASLFGLVSYFVVFVRIPALRDFPWVNLLILAGAVTLSFIGLRRARGRSGRARIGAAVGFVLSVGFAGLLVAYCFVLSNQLPPAENAAKTGAPVPEIVLSGSDDAPIDIRKASEQSPVILVFYRGFW